MTVDELVPIDSPYFLGLLAMLLFARGMDFLSTWIATPNLALEANPIARWLGWKGGIAVNAALCAGFAFWPLPAVVIITASLMVAARNLQSAWIMRSLGEDRYRAWVAQRLLETDLTLYLFCLIGQTVLVSLIGGALMAFSNWSLIPFGVGMGLMTYAAAVFLFTALALARFRRGTKPALE